MISIVVPVYNVEKYITKCLESIVNQSYKDFELILVNDGSTDNSVNIINAYLKNKDVNWKLINKENGGLASARNTGVEYAHGEYISFIDSDDCITDNFLKVLTNNISKDNYDFSFCNFKYIKTQIINKDNNSNTQVFSKDELLNVFLKRTINFVVPSMLLRKSFIIDNNLFFNENIRFSEDQPFIWNVIIHSKKSIYSYSRMYGYYMRDNSIMTSSSYEKIVNSYIEYKDYIETIFGANKEFDSIRSMIVPRWQLGTLYTSAKLLDYEEYERLYILFEGKKIFKKLKKIGEPKTLALAFISLISCKLLYIFCNKLDLNK